MVRPKIPDMAGSDIPDTAGRKTTRRRTQAIAKRYAFHANVISNVKLTLSSISNGLSF